MNETNEKMEVSSCSPSPQRQPSTETQLPLDPITMFKQKMFTLDKDHWVPNKRAKQCFKCYKDFNFWLRRHHCRICGNIFCANCSFKKSLSENKDDQKIRICVNCEDDYKQYMQARIALQREEKGGSELRERKLTKGFTIVKRGSHHLEQPKSGARGFGDEAAEREGPLVSRIKLKEMGEESPAPVFAYAAAPVAEEEGGGVSEEEKELDATPAKPLAEHEKGLEQEDLLLREQENINKMVDDLDYENITKQMQIANLPKEKQRFHERLGYYAKQHIQEIVQRVLVKQRINASWQEMLNEYVYKAVTTVKPSSRLLNDSMDFTNFIKIKLIEWKNSQKSQYINGVVISHNVADKRMRTEIQDPRLLLISNSLCYARDETNFTDLESVIQQEEHYIEILKEKIRSVSPSIVVVEGDVSRAVLDKLRSLDITVITNVKKSSMKRIARCTQTIMIPTTNLLEKSFVLGKCKRFYIEKRGRQTGARAGAGGIVTMETSILYFEGCIPYLGCTIVLSGRDMSELKHVKGALKEMLQKARNVVLENSYLFSCFCDIPLVKRRPSEIESIDEGAPEEALGNPSMLEDIVEEESPFLSRSGFENREKLVYTRVTLKRGFEELATDIMRQEQEEGAGQMEKNLTERELKKKLNHLCSPPEKKVVQFYGAKDQTLGKELRNLARSATLPCDKCKEPIHKHMINIYHKDGMVEITIAVSDKVKREHAELEKDFDDQCSIVMYGNCQVCHRKVTPKQPIMSDLHEYSFAKFLEQYFYNGAIKNRGWEEESFQCSHRIHREITRYFNLNGVKISFTFHPVEPYTIEIVNIKEMDTSEALLRKKDKDAQSLLQSFLQCQSILSNEMRDRRRALKTFAVEVRTLPAQFKHLLEELLDMSKQARADLEAFKDQVFTELSRGEEFHNMFEVDFARRKIFVNLMNYGVLFNKMRLVEKTIVEEFRRRLLPQRERAMIEGGLNTSTISTLTHIEVERKPRNNSESELPEEFVEVMKSSIPRTGDAGGSSANLVEERKKSTGVSGEARRR